MTPGAYLRLRRDAAGLSVRDVATSLPTDPSKSEHERADWIGLIERDETPATLHTIAALRRVFPFDLEILEALAVAHLDAIPVALAICLKCGCTEDDACPGGCWWHAPGLCSACIDPVAQVDAIHAAARGEAA